MVDHIWSPTDVDRMDSLGLRFDLSRGTVVIAQGDPANAVYLLERGKVKLTAVSAAGRQATIALVTPGMFFGETCLANVPHSRWSATAVTDSTVVRIDRAEFAKLIHCQAFAEFFISQLVRRTARYEEDLLDQLFNSSERRLARTLLLLAHFDQGGDGERTIGGMTQETLAQMVGTTRAHVSLFMAKFRRLGLVDYDRHSIRVRPSLMTRLLSN